MAEIKLKAQRQRPRFPVGRLIVYALLIFWAVFMIMPFAWMFLTSLKTRPESMRIPIQWLPAEPQWQNYAEVLNKYDFGRYYFNTILVTVVTIAYPSPARWRRMCLPGWNSRPRTSSSWRA